MNWRITLSVYEVEAAERASLPPASDREWILREDLVLPRSYHDQATPILRHAKARGVQYSWRSHLVPLAFELRDQPVK